MAKPGFDVTIKGMALESNGLTEGHVYDGLGLITFGFIWSCANIWYGPYNSNGATAITTNWSLCSNVSTTWTLYAGSSGASIVTNWTVFSTYYIEDC